MDETYYKNKGSNRLVEHAVMRGKKILEQTQGKEGYLTHAAAVQYDLRSWYSISADERAMEEAWDALGSLLGHALTREDRRVIAGESAEDFED